MDWSFLLWWTYFCDVIWMDGFLMLDWKWKWKVQSSLFCYTRRFRCEIHLFLYTA